MDVPEQDKSVIRLVSVVTFAGFLDTHLLIPILALHAAESGAGIWMVGFIVGLYSLVNTPANIMFGRLVDRVGRRMPLALGLIGDAASMALYAFSRMPLHLVLVRILHGLSGGMVGPSTMSLVTEHGKERKGKAMSFYGSAIAAATLVGYGLSGVMASRFGFNSVFFLGAALLLGGASLTLFLPAEAAARERVTAGTSIRELLKRKGLLISYCSVFAQYFTFGGVVTLLPLYLQSLGMEAFHTGMLLATFAAAFILLQFPVGAISDRMGRLTPVLAGMIVSIIALTFIPAFSTLPPLFIIMAVFGAAYGAIFPSIAAMVADHSSEAERGTASGIFHALLTAGVAAGAPVMGWIGGAFTIPVGLVLTPGIMVIALAAALALSYRIRS